MPIDPSLLRNDYNIVGKSKGLIFRSAGPIFLVEIRLLKIALKQQLIALLFDRCAVDIWMAFYDGYHGFQEVLGDDREWKNIQRKKGEKGKMKMKLLMGLTVI